MKKIIIYGGGTFSPIRNHLSLCAPAFGTTARKLAEMFSSDMGAGWVVLLRLTKMANNKSKLVTNEDIVNDIEKQLADPYVNTIIMNAALCDYDVVDELASFHGQRLQTSLGDRTLQIRPSEKLIDKIRTKRPDIFLVGFKTTTNASEDEQFLTALKMMKRSKCNLVLANDTVTRKNMIITPEESKYASEATREVTLEMLVKMTLDRNDLTYDRTRFVLGFNTDLKAYSSASDTFKVVLKYLVDNGGFIENNGNGFTPEHFCYRTNNYEDGTQRFISSQRKVNHNEVFENGMTEVIVDQDTGEFCAVGSHKPSVGARSQWLLLTEYPEYDCIIHTHNPLKEGSLIPVASQAPFQCGSLECGMNTLNNLKDFDGKFKAVYLHKHGANIMFKSSTPSEEVIKFIEDNIKLGVKTT